MDSSDRQPLEDGQAMVEFTIGALAMFAILFALMWFGFTFGKQLDLKSATRDAARRAAVETDNMSAETIARELFEEQLSLTSGADTTFSITPGPPWEHGDMITVRSSTPHRIELVGLPAWSGTLRAESEIRVE